MREDGGVDPSNDSRCIEPQDERSRYKRGVCQSVVPVETPEENGDPSWLAPSSLVLETRSHLALITMAHQLRNSRHRLWLEKERLLVKIYR